FVAALRASLEEAAGATGILGPRTAPTLPVGLVPAPRPPAPARRRRPGWLVPLVGLLLAAGAGGGIAGALLAGGNDKGKALAPVKQSVSVKTVTSIGTTVVTTAAPPPTTSAPPTTSTPTTTPSSSDPVALNDQA